MQRPVSREETIRATVLSLLFTYAFFFEYLPPVRRVHIPYDLEGYHYPLLSYAFHSLRQGRFPSWDASMYCGLSFAGNIQAGLFYPPNWLLFLANIGRERLAFWSLEALVFAHVWLAFVLCYLWLRAKRLEAVPCALGAGVFAFSGHALIQIQHVGVICGYAWMPLGLWAIDEAAESGRWRPMWKLAAASAMCLLAGYPPTWFAFCMLAAVYALGGTNRWRVTVWTGLAIAFSQLIAMVQLLPAWQTQAMKIAEVKYGIGVVSRDFFLSFLLPNYFDSRIDAPLLPHGADYLYLGVPALFGLGWMLWRRAIGSVLPLLAMLAVSLVAVWNPLLIISDLAVRYRLFGEICRDWYFVAGIVLSVAGVSAVGLNGFLKRGGSSPRGWLTPVVIALLSAWAIGQLRMWSNGGERLAVGWRSALYPAVLLGLFWAGCLLMRSSEGSRRAWLSGALLLAAGIDYKVFGTSKQFNARSGDNDETRIVERLPGMINAVYQTLLANSEYRIAIDPLTGPFPSELRSLGLATPQGMDPMMPAQYREKMKALMRPGEARILDLDPSNVDLLRSLGARYFLTADSGQFYRTLTADSRFRLLEPSQSYFKTFELRDPWPPYRWQAETRPAPASVERIQWQPERRVFQVKAAAPGRLVLVEQFYPGWRAEIDGRPAEIERWDDVFQAVRVPTGDHRITFQYPARAVWLGAAVSALSLAVMCAAVLRSAPRARYTQRSRSA